MLRSIRSRLLALVLAVALPLLGVLVWVFWAEISRVHNSARDLALRIARSIASDLRLSHEHPRALFDQMSKRAKVRHPRPNDCDTYFDIVDFYPQYLNLLLYDTAGNIVCSSTPSAADARYSAVIEPAITKYLRAAHSGKLETMVAPIRGKWISVVFQPVMDGPKTTGVLALEEYLDLEVDPYPNGTVVTIVDGHGRIIARSPDGPRWIGHSIQEAGLSGLALQGNEGRAEARGIDGVLRQYGYTRVQGSDWLLYVGIPAGVARSAVRSLIVRGITAGLIICALVVLLALQLAATIKSPLDVLANAAQHVAEEGYSGQVPANGPREVAVVGQAFNRMIESRSDAEKALNDSRIQLQALSKKLLDVQEEERSRIAREIHDELGQLLTALNMDIGGLLKSAEPLTPDQKTMSRRIRQALMETMTSVQRIAAELRPAALDDFGLVAAIESDVNNFEQRTGVECDLSFPDDTVSLGPDVDAAIYRIVQEAMTNVARHSDATRIEIRLRRRPDEMLVEIRDDGKGIAPHKLRDRASLGIAGMRERAHRIGAILEVEGIEGHGTIVSVRIPLQNRRAESS
jgi:signal transduction histidine kinase